MADLGLDMDNIGGDSDLSGAIMSVSALLNPVAYKSKLVSIVDKYDNPEANSDLQSLI